MDIFGDPKTTLRTLKDHKFDFFTSHSFKKSKTGHISPPTGCIMNVVSLRNSDEASIQSVSEQSVSERVLEFYGNVASGDFSKVESLYAEDVHFEDPTHAINGRDRLKAHFKTLYDNCNSCSFKFHQTVDTNSEIFLAWTMFINHPRIRGGKIVRVEGSSFIKTHDGQVIYHREYYDLGSLVYENLPVFGPLTRFIKSRLAR